MGIWISIRKTDEQNSACFYKIETEAHGGFEGYVGIDTREQSIAFYNNNFALLKKFFKANLDEPINGHGIPGGIVGKVLSKVMKALDKNEFPDSLDYCA